MELDIGLAKLTVDLCRIANFDAEAAEAAVVDRGGTGFVFDDASSTQSFTSVHQHRFFLTFRGTESIADWLTNARFLPSTREGGVKIHSGFIAALDQVWAGIRSRVPDGTPIVVTGHSLGGALAALAAWRLVRDGVPVESVYTYGQPRTGHGDFRSAYDSALGERTFRFINHIDLVTRVPLLIQGYRHVGRRMYFDAAGNLVPDAGAWAIARDDAKFRLTHFGRLRAVGVDPHLIGPYQRRVDNL